MVRPASQGTAASTNSKSSDDDSAPRATSAPVDATRQAGAGRRHSIRISRSSRNVDDQCSSNAPADQR